MDGSTVWEAEALRGAARMIISAAGMTETSRRVSDQMGQPVSAVSLKRALQDSRIVGMRSHFTQKERDRWDKERLEGKHDGKPLPFAGRDEQNGPRLVNAVWDPILDEDTWRAVR